MFITINLHIQKIGMQDINILKISIKQYSFSGSIRGIMRHETEAYGPQFVLYYRKISFWGCRKQEMVQSDRRMTSFLLNLMSGVLLIHRWEIVHTSLNQLTLIWDSVSSTKVHYHININRFNMHIVDKCMKTVVLQQWQWQWKILYCQLPQK